MKLKFGCLLGEPQSVHSRAFTTDVHAQRTRGGDLVAGIHDKHGSSAYHHAVPIISWNDQILHAAPTPSHLLCVPARSPTAPSLSCATGTTTAAQ